MKLRRTLTMMVGWLGLLFYGGPLAAQPHPDNPERWSIEMRGGIFQPTGGAMKQFYSGCCNVTGSITGGWLYDSKFGIDVGLGVFTKGGAARGQTTGRASQETFSLLLIPMQLEGTFRIDYGDEQPVAPYFKGGVDFIYFRESGQGTVVKGLKTGVHGGGGVMVLLNNLSDDRVDRQFGINDIFLILDGRYQWVNNFGGGGLDLSGYAFTAGIHMQL